MKGNGSGFVLISEVRKRVKRRKSIRTKELIADIRTDFPRAKFSDGSVGPAFAQVRRELGIGRPTQGQTTEATKPPESGQAHGCDHGSRPGSTSGGENVAGTLRQRHETCSGGA